MRNRRVLIEMPPNLNEDSDDAFMKMKEIKKITNRCNQNYKQSIKSEPINDIIEYIPYIPDSYDEYNQNIQKLIRHQKKFLQYFNAKSLETVINMYSDLKCHEVQLKKKIKVIKEKYMTKINNLQIQNQSDQQKIELLEKTINSLHNENDKNILIIESLQNENVLLSEKNVSDQINNKATPKTLPIANNYCNIKNDFLLNENQNLKAKCLQQEIDIQNLKLEAQKQEIEMQNIKNECKKQETENQNLRVQNQRFQQEIEKLKNQIVQINNDKIVELQQAEENYAANLKNDSDKLIRLVKKYKKENDLLNLNKNTLETENKALLTSLNHQSFLKSALKSLKRQNFKLEVEVENLKMKNFKSPFQSPPRKDINDDKMIDIGIITSFSENNLSVNEIANENTDFQRLFIIEKERRKLLANLLSKIIKMFDAKCNQLLYNFSALMDSQSTRIQNIIAIIHDFV